MAAGIIFLLITLCVSGVIDAKGRYFTYTINNDVLDTHFRQSLNLTIQPHSFLIDYMEKACRIAPDKFTKFTATYFPKYLGYFIDSINGVAGNKTVYWWITINKVPLKVGVSAYVPKPNDDILFDLTVGK